MDGAVRPNLSSPPQLQIILRRTKPNTNCLRGEGEEGDRGGGMGGGGREERAGVVEGGGEGWAD
jgi:hypothetical protein